MTLFNSHVFCGTELRKENDNAIAMCVFNELHLGRNILSLKHIRYF